MEPFEEFYDIASTIFSPDGRLFQVEYAHEAIVKGAPSIGLKYADGVILMVYKERFTSLTPPDSIEKIFQVDDHIGCAASGLIPDARHLVEFAREEAQINQFVYDERIPVKILVEQVCDYTHLFTQFDGVRPFGVALIFAGVDHLGNHLYVTDPSGASIGYKAVCEGEGSQKAMSFFKSHYKTGLPYEQALDLGLQALQKTMRKKLTVDTVDIAIINERECFRRLTHDEISGLISRYQ
ncbi:MAG: archaeal proteasome endopeptidase complex subunit alpha [Candidatus Thermoplasmatota archaeon]